LPLAATDPDRAERIATSVRGRSEKAWALSHVAGGLAATDPDRAERIATSIRGKYAKASALTGIAGGGARGVVIRRLQPAKGHPGAAGLTLVLPAVWPLPCEPGMMGADAR
jgi:hypothetical protein